ncbi:MAG: GNAT family N-acetyltransferase [Spirochaetia bacterium]|nr:GNAT family N-acetyltransferase [Spirochaetia bacterium]MCF7942543.1 GNAT family N-acetyltransferase [Spirochaetia bacterium]
MPDRSRFIAAEHCYSSLFAHSCRTEYGMRYTDALIPDMYCHNYLRLDTDRIRDFASACEQERSYRTGLGQKTVHIVIDDVRADTLASYVPAAYCKDVIMMAAGVEEVSRLQLPAAPGILIRVAQDPADLEIGALIDMRAFGEPFRDFARRRFERRKAVYCDPAIAFEHIICTRDGEPVGNCDLMIDHELAKIEDVDILEGHQHRGYGTSLLLHAVTEAWRRKAETVFLQVEADNLPALGLYGKLGFKAVMHSVQYTRSLTE